MASKIDELTVDRFSLPKGVRRSDDKMIIRESVPWEYITPSNIDGFNLIIGGFVMAISIQIFKDVGLFSFLEYNSIFHIVFQISQIISMFLILIGVFIHFLSDFVIPSSKYIILTEDRFAIISRTGERDIDIIESSYYSSLDDFRLEDGKVIIETKRNRYKLKCDEFYTDIQDKMIHS
jgi:hypothetical protein